MIERGRKRGERERERVSEKERERERKLGCTFPMSNLDWLDWNELARDGLLGDIIGW